MALGFIASYAPDTADTVIASGGVACLKESLLEDGEDHVKSAAVWSLGQLGKHGEEGARALAEVDVLRHIMILRGAADASDDLREKCRRCLKGECGARAGAAAAAAVRSLWQSQHLHVWSRQSWLWHLHPCLCCSGVEQVHSPAGATGAHRSCAVGSTGGECRRTPRLLLLLLLQRSGPPHAASGVWFVPSCCRSFCPK